ncbi:hypothetical protein [Phytoactinopolyspora endophytica]|uniref:hypothetical protein n=1 Tax=Phytoactinopolyspora endophytica TaxID=1642495 RepID=UPI00101DAB5F|nr:hypothetical protein [Phytoactinopolyspora endophytica]
MSDRHEQRREEVRRENRTNRYVGVTRVPEDEIDRDLFESTPQDHERLAKRAMAEFRSRKLVSNVVLSYDEWFELPYGADAAIAHAVLALAGEVRRVGDILERQGSDTSGDTSAQGATSLTGTSFSTGPTPTGTPRPTRGQPWTDPDIDMTRSPSSNGDRS